MNKIILQRQKRYPNEIVGQFQTEDGVFMFFTMERLFDGLPKVIAGTYDCVRFHSPHLGYEVFMLKDVPGHDYILIHIANFYSDLEGCIGIGKGLNPLKTGEEMLTDSKIAFQEFMKIQAGLATWKLVVQD